MTFETFDEIGKETSYMTWPKKRKTNTNTKTMTKTNTAKEHLQRVILVTCDIWDTGYISDDWEPEFMTIFVTCQLSVTWDSIRNSCDVLLRGFLSLNLSLWANRKTQGCFLPLHFYNSMRELEEQVSSRQITLGGSPPPINTMRGIFWIPNLEIMITYCFRDKLITVLRICYAIDGSSNVFRLTFSVDIFQRGSPCNQIDMRNMYVIILKYTWLIDWLILTGWISECFCQKCKSLDCEGGVQVVQNINRSEKKKKTPKL